MESEENGKRRNVERGVNEGNGREEKGYGK